MHARRLLIYLGCLGDGCGASAAYRGLCPLGGSDVGGGTWNLGCGARHRQLWVDEADGEMRNLIKDLVRSAVRRGQCLIDKVMEEETWKGCEHDECGVQS